MSLVIVIPVVVVILVILGPGVAAFWDPIVRGWNKLVQEAEGSEALSPTQQAPTRSSNNMSFSSPLLPAATASCSGSAECFNGTVTHIVDGDTIDVDDYNTTRIRLALVDAPEVYEEGYEQAKQFASSLCPIGSQVLVDQDDAQLHDGFGRMLAKVTCYSGAANNNNPTQNLNAELLNNGHAYVMNEYCSVSEFSREKWVEGYGCGRDDAASSLETLPPQPPPSSRPSNDDEEEDENDENDTSDDNGDGDCDPSYPDVCIPSPPPDLDCPDVSERDFAVVGSDPHRFDREGDGIGCE
jgi:micrococcal nuclease